jgi:hypothetical protein
LQLKLTIEGELQELPPPEGLKDLSDDDTPGIYERLSEHMKSKYDLNIDDLKAVTKNIPVVDTSVKPTAVNNIPVKPTPPKSNITVKTIIQVVDAYKELMKKRANEEITKSKAFIAQKDKTGSTQCLQMKQIYLDEIDTLPDLKTIQSFSDDDAPGIYERLGDHMKAMYKIDIAELATIPTVSQTTTTSEKVQVAPKVQVPVIPVAMIGTILEKYKMVLLARADQEVVKSKTFLKSGDKPSAIKCMEMKKIFLNEIDTLPGPEDLKQFTEDDTAGIYDRLGDHMKTMFSINIEDLKTSKEKPTVVAIEKPKEKKSLHTKEEVIRYQSIYKSKLEQLVIVETDKSKQYLLKKDRESAIKCVQIKQLYLTEIETCKDPVTDPDAAFASLASRYPKFIGEEMVPKMDSNRILKIVANYRIWLDKQAAHQMDLAKEFTIKKDKDSAKDCLLRKKEYLDEKAAIPNDVFIKTSDATTTFEGLSQHILEKFQKNILDFEIEEKVVVEKKDLFFVQNVIKNGAELLIRTCNGTYLSLATKVEHVSNPIETCTIVALQNGQKYVFKCGTKTLSVKDDEVKGDLEKIKQENQWTVTHQKGKFGFESHHGKFLSLKKSMLFSSSSCSLVSEMGDKELFEVLFVDKVQDLLNMKLAFKTHHGTYVSANKDGSIEQKDTLTKNEVFVLIPMENKFALESTHKSCLMVEEDGKVSFSKGTTVKKVRFQVEILRTYASNLIGIRFMRKSEFLSARKGFFEKHPFTTVATLQDYEFYSIEVLK